MDFIYEIIPDKKEVKLTGIDGECPKELHIPPYIEINNEEVKVTHVHFGSPLAKFYTKYGNGVTCEIIHIPETVKHISLGYNKHLKEVFLPNSMTKMGNSCFTYCENLKTVHLPKNLEAIGWNTFKGCRSVEEIFLPSTLQKIGFGCFMNCSSLVKITIPNGVKELGISFFENCSNLREITIENKDIEIYPTTFQGCKSLSKIDHFLIEDGLLYNLDKTELYTYLGNNKNNGNVIVPTSVHELGNGFASSSELVYVDLSKTQIETIYHDTFKNSINLKKVILPPTIKSIHNDAFNGCYNLSEINLPDSIEYIGCSCFANSGLKEIELPKNLKEILMNTFKGCKELSEVYIPLNVETIYNSAFENCDKIWHVVISEGFREKLPQIFKHHDKIGFGFILQNSAKFKRRGAFTHGRIRPCPYCGSNNVNTFCDGTAECNSCGGEYIYQR